MKTYNYLRLFFICILLMSSCSSEDDKGASDDAPATLIGTWKMTSNTIVNGVGVYTLGQETVTTETTFDFDEDGNIYTVTFLESGTVTETGGFRGVLTFTPNNGDDAFIFENYSINVGNDGYELLNGVYTANGNQLSVTRSDASYDATYAINGNVLTISFDIAEEQTEIFQDLDITVTGTYVIILEKQ